MLSHLSSVYGFWCIDDVSNLSLAIIDFEFLNITCQFIW